MQRIPKAGAADEGSIIWLKGRFTSVHVDAPVALGLIQRLGILETLIARRKHVRIHSTNIGGIADMLPIRASDYLLSFRGLEPSKNITLLVDDTIPGSSWMHDSTIGTPSALFIQKY